jgi:hypothetical protein
MSYNLFFLRCVAWRLFSAKMINFHFLPLSRVTKSLDAWAISKNGRTLLCPFSIVSRMTACQPKKKLNENDINKGSQFPMRDCKPCPFLLINVYHIFHQRIQQAGEKSCWMCTHIYAWVSTSAVVASKKTKERESLEIFIIIISCGFCADDIFHHHIGFFLLAFACRLRISLSNS